jgi:hypothetical protein
VEHGERDALSSCPRRFDHRQEREAAGDDAKERAERQHHFDAEARAAVGSVAGAAQGENEQDRAERQPEVGVDLEQARRDRAGVGAGERREQRRRGDKTDARDQPCPDAGEPGRELAQPARVQRDLTRSGRP